jgi:hypothetical protein
MKSKVTIEENETKIILIPQNQFEIDMIKTASEEKYNLIAEITADNSTWNPQPKHKLELLISKHTGVIDLYPRLKESYNYQKELLITINRKLELEKGTKVIHEIKALLAEWGNQPSQNF